MPDAYSSSDVAYELTYRMSGPTPDTTVRRKLHFHPDPLHRRLQAKNDRDAKLEVEALVELERHLGSVIEPLHLTRIITVTSTVRDNVPLAEVGN